MHASWDLWSHDCCVLLLVAYYWPHVATYSLSLIYCFWVLFLTVCDFCTYLFNQCLYDFVFKINLLFFSKKRTTLCFSILGIIWGRCDVVLTTYFHVQFGVVVNSQLITCWNINLKTKQNKQISYINFNFNFNVPTS